MELHLQVTDGDPQVAIQCGVTALGQPGWILFSFILALEIPSLILLCSVCPPSVRPSVPPFLSTTFLVLFAFPGPLPSPSLPPPPFMSLHRGQGRGQPGCKQGWKASVPTPPARAPCHPKQHKASDPIVLLSLGLCRWRGQRDELRGQRSKWGSMFSPSWAFFSPGPEGDA